MSYQLEPLSATFDLKVSLTPQEMNRIRQESDKDPLSKVLLESVKNKLESRCSTHGWVVPESITILSRSMGHLENGRYTGNIIFHVQLKADVLNPANGDLITAQIETVNEMGIMAIYSHRVKELQYEAIKVLVVKDESLDVSRMTKGEMITVQLQKSRFQINDEHILSVGDLMTVQPALTNAGSGPNTDTAEAITV
jgi:DNA-directed RNA polymerase subunit E'/Rpb7